MKIYNQDKTQELKEQDLEMSLGHLVDDKIVTTHHEATEAIPAKSVAEQIVELTEQGIKVKEIGGKQYRVTRTYPNGGEDVEKITELPAVPAKAAYDEYEDIQVYVPYTEQELQEIADKRRHAELKTELAKIKEDIEQESFGLVRDDYEVKKERAAAIINELRVLEGKEPREVRPSVL